VGLQPQPPHYDVVCPLGDNHNSRKDFKNLTDKSSGRVLIRVKTHRYAHPQHLKVVKHPICVWQGCVSHLGWVYSHPQLPHYDVVCPTWGTQNQNSRKDFTSLADKRGVIMTHPCAHPLHVKVVKHATWRFSNTQYVFGNDVGAILGGSTVLTTTLWFGLPLDKMALPTAQSC
jgi:hypothetical protein